MSRRGAVASASALLCALCASAAGRADERAPGPSGAEDAAPAVAALPGDADSWSASGAVAVLDRGGHIEVWDVRAGRSFPLPGRAAAPLRDAVHWSPAGDRFALELRVAGGAADIWVVETGHDEPRLHRLTFAGGAAPRWIAGGRRLIYEGPVRGGGTGLLMREEGGLGPERAYWDEPEPGPAALGPSVQA